VNVIMSKRQTVKVIDRRIDEFLGKIVKITWGDAHGSHNIVDVDYLRELAEIESVGWLIYENKELVTLASFKNATFELEYFDDFKDKFRYYIVIPRKTIWRVRGL